MTAPESVVRAVQEAFGCKPYPNPRGGIYCRTRHGGAWIDRGCSVAVDAADAAWAAVEAENARLTGQVERVKALAADMEERGRPDVRDSPMDAQSRRQVREDAARLRAALSDTTGEATSRG